MVHLPHTFLVGFFDLFFKSHYKDQTNIFLKKKKVGNSKKGSGESEKASFVEFYDF